MTKARISAETVAAGLTFLIGCAAIYGSVQLGIGSLTSPEPGFFPLLAALLLAALSAVLLGFNFAGAPAEATSPEPEAVEETQTWAALTAIAGLVAYVFLLAWLGYLIATTLLLAALLGVFGVRRVLPYFIAAPLIAGGSYLLFGRLLDLPLPSGPFGF